MSVLIKGLGMPDCCDKCCLRQINLARCQVTGKSTSHAKAGKPTDEKKRPAWCPLVEVLVPHGRLIDADALIADANERYKQSEIECEKNVADGPMASLFLSTAHIAVTNALSEEYSPTVLEPERDK